VIGGPNSGAEFSMQPGEFLLGTDPTSCDIVFHDTSVSRQHLRIIVSDENTLSIEDLSSRNGTVMDGVKITERKPLSINTVITIGTTSFMVFDREGEMKTIVSPVIEEKREAPEIDEEPEEAVDRPSLEMQEAAKHALKETVIKDTREERKAKVNKVIFGAVATGILLVVGIGLTSLFISEEIVKEETVDTNKILAEAFAPFPSVRYSYNKATGKLLIVGHVLTPSDRNQLLYNLQGMRFIKSIDEDGIIVDEYVWREVNHVLNRNRSWRSINVHSPEPGRFVLSGYLKTRRESDQLADYISTNFPYLDLLERNVIVEEDLINGVNITLKNRGMDGITVEMSDGVLTLTGSIIPGQRQRFNDLVEEFRSIPGVRGVKTFITELAPEKKIIDISDKYRVSGHSQIGANVSVIVNGKIYSKGDKLNGMQITKITRNAIFLERDGVEYRINFK
jgi:type III secretion system YscD/HrpQ family protein